MQFINKLRKSILTISLISIAVATLGLVLLFNLYYRPVVRSNLTYDNDLLTSRIENYFFSEFERLSKIGNLQVTRTVLNSDQNFALNTQFIEALTTRLNVEVAASNGLEALYIFNSEKEIASFYDPNKDSHPPLNLTTATFYTGTQNLLLSDLDNSYYDALEDTYLPIISPIVDRDGFIGSIVALYDISKINPFRQTSYRYPSTTRVIFDNQGAIINSTIVNHDNTLKVVDIFNKKELKEKINGFEDFSVGSKKFLGHYQFSKDLGWTIITVISKSEYYSPFINGFPLIVIIILLIVTILTGSLRLTDKFIGNPIHQLLKGMEQAQLQNYHYVIEESHFGDFSTIIQTFNKMMSNIATHTEKITLTNKELNTLTKNIPGGLFICAVDEGFSFKLVSEPFAKLSGFKGIEELYESSQSLFINTVEPTNRKSVKEAFAKGDEGVFEYRPINSKNKILSCSFRITEDLYFGDKLIMFALAVDMTKQHQVFERLNRGEKRFQIILNQTDEVIFEWSVKKQKLLYTSNNRNWLSMFGYTISKKKENMFDHQLKMPKEDLTRFNSFITDVIHKKKRQGRIDVRLTRIDYQQYESLFWARIMISPLVNNKGEVYHLIGRIVDINEQKKESIELRELSIKDHLTSLLNRRSFSQSVVNLLDSSASSINTHFLMMVDIDNFKSINDTYGHIFGDNILKDVANILKESFRMTDLFGRVGGDEFAAALINFNDKDVLEDKIKNLLERFRQKGLTCSVGVACYPIDGLSFDDLYINADKALYSIKNGAKNNYAFYSDCTWSK